MAVVSRRFPGCQNVRPRPGRLLTTVEMPARYGGTVPRPSGRPAAVAAPLFERQKASLLAKNRGFAVRLAVFARLSAREKRRRRYRSAGALQDGSGVPKS